ncbi:MAG: hypothetical protein QM496_16080 [Verrucomicrobiota bacterium]
MKEAVEMLTRGEALFLMVGTVVFACGVWAFQNHGERRGGKISPIKAAWFAYVLMLWVVLPLVLLREGTAFVVLAVSMGLRVLVEIPLCLTRRWRVAYGVLHDLFHIGLVLVVMYGFAVPGLKVWGTLTIVSLISELLFVRWFVKATGGPGKGVYFVPGGDGYRSINYSTAGILFPQAIGFFYLLMSAIR